MPVFSLIGLIGFSFRNKLYQRSFFQKALCFQVAGEIHTEAYNTIHMPQATETLSKSKTSVVSYQTTGCNSHLTSRKTDSVGDQIQYPFCIISHGPSTLKTSLKLPVPQKYNVKSTGNTYPSFYTKIIRFIEPFI